MNFTHSSHKTSHINLSKIVYIYTFATVRVSTPARVNLSSILHEKDTFSILHYHIFKTPTSVHLFYKSILIK